MNTKHTYLRVETNLLKIGQDYYLNFRYRKEVEGRDFWQKKMFPIHTFKNHKSAHIYGFFFFFFYQKEEGVIRVATPLKLDHKSILAAEYSV